MNDMSQPEQRSTTPIQPEAPLSATLQAQEWNVVLGALQEMPMRVARPVFDKLVAQLSNVEPR